MAGVSKDGKGYRIRFTFSGKRCQLRLKGHNRRQAEMVQRHVEALMLHRLSGQAVDTAAALWLSDIGEDLYEKLYGFGVVQGRAVTRGSERLCNFIERFISKGRTNSGRVAKSGTAKNWQYTADFLLACTGNSVSVENFTEADASGFRSWLEDREEINMESSVRRHCQVAQMFFTAAIRARLIDRNPFANVPTACINSKDRDHFVTREEFDACVRHCPDHQWTMILYLARVAAMRNPSEVMSATWDHVDWKNRRLTVISPKTEAYAGREKRVIPLFSELEAVLRVGWEQCPPGENRIITRFNTPDANMHKTFVAIMKRAGVKQWPKLFQNMRASRENELIDNGVRPDVAANWLGHTEQVQRSNYLQVNDHHFEEALSGGPKVAHLSVNRTNADDLNI